MDTMYREKARQAEEALAKAKNQKSKKHVADEYSPKLRPRETHPDAVSSEKRISKNLDKLNRELVETPESARSEGILAVGEDRGVRVITKKVAVKASAPISIIATCAFIVLVFMYMLSLNVQIDEYSHSIDQMQSEIAELKEEATQLEIRLEGKYDLDEVERIATQEYGMVAASTLPKKYISVTAQVDAATENKEEEKGGFFEAIADFFRS